MMKISLFFKPQSTKVYFLLIMALVIIGAPNHANAGFFSDLVAKVLPQTQAADVINSTNPNEIVHNSQTVPLLETSINPDAKSADNNSNVSIIEDEALISTNSPLGHDDLEKYASSARINTYKVKEGDTIEGIAKKLKVSKSTLLASNSDLKKSDLLKIGQVLVVLPIKSTNDKVDKADKADKVIVKKDTSPTVDKKKVADKVDDSKDDTVYFTINTDTPSPNQTQDEPKVDQPEQNTPSGQPTGTITGGYIWILPKGIGRITQMLHGANGIDIGGPKGTPILAPRDGTILIARGTGWNGAYGHYVVENFDNGAQGLFAHMGDVAVENGQIVKQGDILGEIGMTGHTTGPHVHFETRGTPHPYRNLHVNATSIEDND